MSIQSVGFKAYSQALQNFAKAESKAKAGAMPEQTPEGKGFSELMSSSLGKVNELQAQRSAQITAFASGENQNVHELMISLQKAGLAMNMTAAVRNKVMEAYKELSRMQF